MWDWLRRFLGPVEKGEEQKISRTVADVVITVTEGLDGTRQVSVTGWNHERAFELFKLVRDELRREGR